MEDLENIKSQTTELVNNIEFIPGNQYQDFNPATDTVAEYGLLGLIGVVAAKKT